MASLDAALHSILSKLHGDRALSVEELAVTTKLSPDAIRRHLAALEGESWVYVEREKSSSLVLTPNGKAAAEKGLPELRVGNALKKKEMELKALQSLFDGNPGEFSAGFGLAKRNNWIAISPKDGKTIISLTPEGTRGMAHSPAQHLLDALAKGELPPSDSPIVEELKARGLVEWKHASLEKVRITQAGKKALKELPVSASQTIIGALTPDILVSGKWKNASFKPYEVSIPVEPTYPGRIHPLRQTILDVRRVMVELGFSEEESPLVESSFWNMDVMFIPQDHPAREIQDTFYIPGQATLPDADLVKRVKATHEHGGKTGSKGFGYEWDSKIAMQLLLRTHGSATTFRTLGKGHKPPLKTFSIGRVFRNEALDATHLAEFYQVDGLIMGEGLTLRHLMGIIKEFYSKLGVDEIKFYPTYNPYTEPSMQAVAYHPTLKKWVELINCGMFRPETLKPLGITVPVISWGFGLERLALFIHQKSTVREILGPDVDLNFIRTYAGTTHQMRKGKE